MKGIVEEKSLTVVSIADSWGFDKAIIDAFFQEMNNLKPVYLQFLNPGKVIAFYDETLDTGRIKSLTEKIHDIVKVHYEKLEKTTCKVFSAKFTYSVDKKGNLISMPIGGLKEELDNNCVIFEET